MKQDSYFYPLKLILGFLAVLLVPLLARDLTCPAADAIGDVDQR